MTEQESQPLVARPSLSAWRQWAIVACLLVAVICAIRVTSRTAVATPSTRTELPAKQTQSIETIQLGQRVVSLNPLREEAQDPSKIDPVAWRAVQLRAHLYDSSYELAFLRSLTWIKETGATVGGTIDLNMPEIGMVGPAEIVAIDPCPPIETDDGTGRMVVTGIMSHPASNVIDISIEGEAKPLGTTDTHPIWSVDRKDFVHAGELRVGEKLQRADGAITQITRITPHTGPPVMTYNLEVDGQHVYHVGDGALLVHNQNCVQGGTLGSWMSQMKPGEYPATPVRTGPGRPGKTGLPNSIYIQNRPDGGRSVTYFDELGRAFAREDYGQLRPHKQIGLGPDGRALPHEHMKWFNPRGGLTAEKYRPIDANGKPTGDWIPE